MFKKKHNSDIYPNITVIKSDIDTSHTIWCKDAQLIYVQGKGILKPVYKEYEERSYGDYSLCQLMLNNKPLVQINAPDCPTCESMLAAGYGIESINCE